MTDSETPAHPPGYRLAGPLIARTEGTPLLLASEVERALEEMDEAELAEYLPGALDEGHHRVDDEEALRRREELDSGEVRGLTFAEFKEECGRGE